MLVSDGQERMVTTTAADRRRPARRAGRRAQRDRPHQPLPDPGAAQPHAPAGLPRAGLRGQRDRRGRARDGSRPPTRRPSRATRRSPRPGVDGEKVDRLPRDRRRRRRDRPRGAELRGHPRAGRRAGHRRARRPARPNSPSADGLNWAALAQCESGGRPDAVSASATYRGMYQFSPRTWTAVGGSGDPAAASAERADLPRADALRRAPAPASGRTAARACSADRLPLSTPPEQPDGLLGPAAIRELAQQLELRPTKSLGQNFLHDANTIRRIVRTAELRPDDVVLEVGPGLGSLTLGLLPAAARVVAVEIDPAPGRPAAGDGGRPHPAPRRPAHGRGGRRAAAARAARPAADGAGRQPAVQRRRARCC